MSTLRIYEVPAPTQANPRPDPVQLESCVVAADGDAAKSAAKALLTDQGFDVRSINWGPGLKVDGPPDLIAYVSKKEPRHAP